MALHCPRLTGVIEWNGHEKARHNTGRPADPINLSPPRKSTRVAHTYVAARLEPSLAVYPERRVNFAPANCRLPPGQAANTGDTAASTIRRPSVSPGNLLNAIAHRPRNRSARCERSRGHEQLLRIMQRAPLAIETSSPLARRRGLFRGPLSKKEEPTLATLGPDANPTARDNTRAGGFPIAGSRNGFLIEARRPNLIKISFLIKIGGAAPRRDYPRPASRIMFAINNLFGANEPPNIYGPTRARARNKISRLCR